MQPKPTPRPDARPVAYIRRSITRVGDEGDISRDAQTEAVRRLAGGDAASLTILDGDWGRTASTDGVAKRLDFLRLMAMVEAGNVSVIYALSGDRLARSVEWASRLWNACQRTGTRIVTDEDGEYDTSSDRDWDSWTRAAQENERALRRMKHKAQRAAEQRQRRGDAMGALPYGYRRVRAGEATGPMYRVSEGHMERVESNDPKAVVLVPDPAEPLEPIREAWEASGHRFRGACRMLGERGIRSKRGGLWDRPSLLRLVEREGWPLPMRGPSGRRETPPTPALFSKLLVCGVDGHLLTPNRHRERRRQNETMTVSYYCGNGHRARLDHEAVYVSEAKLLPLIRAEADRLRPPFERVEYAADDEAERAKIEARKRRVGDRYELGEIERDEYRQKIADLDAALARLGSRATAEIVPDAINWTWHVEKINTALRALFVKITVGPDLLPHSPDDFTWAVPEWRAPDLVVVHG